jgi:ceramide glucosyltransferase
MMATLAGGAAVLAAIGLAEALLAARLVAAFARDQGSTPSFRPPVTVLKPLHGDEPLLEAALTTLCRQHYPAFQIVCGVQDAADPAVAVVRRLQERFAELDIALVVDPTLHGRNRKVGNLINMMAAARHDVLVIADADIHVRADYLDRLIAALQCPGVGLVTTLYAGLPVTASACGSPRPSSPGEDAGTTSASPVADLPASPAAGLVSSLPATLFARLGATQITHGFLPGALLARAFGRQDCLGATMCLHRHDLERVGGLHALVDHLADDNVLGRRIAASGLRVAMADTLTLTTVPETTLGAMFRHELRWARTTRALEPAGFAASVLRYSLAWALLTIPLTSGSLWSAGGFLVAWVLRAVAAMAVGNALARLWTRHADPEQPNAATALAFSCPVWLLPVRDLLSVAVMLASYGGRRVRWRGHDLHADSPPPLTRQSAATHTPARRPPAFRPYEETEAR